MARFSVVFFYNASEAYKVEADDADEALVVARRERQNQNFEEFVERLGFDEANFTVEEMINGYY